MSVGQVTHQRDARGILHVEVQATDLLDDDAIDAVAAEITRLVDAEPAPRVVLSFPNARTVSSNVLGALIALHNRVRSRGGTLRLAAVGTKLDTLLRVTHLASVLDVHPTPEQAAASIA